MLRRLAAILGALVLLVSCSSSGTPAGLHECALLMQEEVDGFLSADVGPGEFNAPLIRVSVCTWTSGDTRLTLRLWEDPVSDWGLLGFEPMQSTFGETYRKASGKGIEIEAGEYEIVLVSDGLVINMAHVPADGISREADLLRVATIVAERLP
jgi:hypothetical protein